MRPVSAIDLFVSSLVWISYKYGNDTHYPSSPNLYLYLNLFCWKAKSLSLCLSPPLPPLPLPSPLSPSLSPSLSLPHSLPLSCCRKTTLLSEWPWIYSGRGRRGGGGGGGAKKKTSEDKKNTQGHFVRPRKSIELRLSADAALIREVRVGGGIARVRDVAGGIKSKSHTHRSVRASLEDECAF